MRVCIFKSGKIEDVENYVGGDIKKIDVLILPFSMFEKINYKLEITGDTNYMSRVADVSRKTSGVVFVGGNYDLYGRNYISCLVCENGKILGVSDEVEKLDNKSIKIYKVKGKTYVVVVGKDVYDKTLIKTLIKYNPDFILTINYEIQSVYYASITKEIANNYEGEYVSLNKDIAIAYQNSEAIAFSDSKLLDFNLD